MATSNITTLYCIYRIVCFPTGRCYVGQTLDFRNRKREHFYYLSRGDHHSYKLQKDFNIHGMSAFYVEVLEKGITQQLIDQREIYWIAHFDSYQNGYNQTEGGTNGNHLGDKCTWNDIEYNSLSEAARANGVWVATIIRRLELGYTCDDDMPGLAKECTWNGIIYPSQALAARALGITNSAMADRLRKGFTCDDDLKHGGQQCEWNGVFYKSNTEASAAIGVTISTINSRIRKGYKSDMDLPKHAKRCIWNGIEYESILAAAVANGIKQSTMHYRLNRGYSSDEQVEAAKASLKPPPIIKGRKPPNMKSVIWNGVTYESSLEASQLLGIGIAAIRSRVKAGYTHDTEMIGTGHNNPTKPCMWNGINYHSLSEAARLLGISKQCLRWRLGRGYTSDDDMRRTLPAS